jgi:hypothetical protein
MTRHCWFQYCSTWRVIALTKRHIVAVPRWRFVMPVLGLVGEGLVGVGHDCWEGNRVERHIE